VAGDGAARQGAPAAAAVTSSRSESAFEAQALVGVQVDRGVVLLRKPRRARGVAVVRGRRRGAVRRRRRRPPASHRRAPAARGLGAPRVARERGRLTSATSCRSARPAARSSSRSSTSGRIARRFDAGADVDVRADRRRAVGDGARARGGAPRRGGDVLLGELRAVGGARPAGAPMRSPVAFGAPGPCSAPCRGARCGSAGGGQQRHAGAVESSSRPAPAAGLQPWARRRRSLPVAAVDEHVERLAARGRHRR